MPSIVPSLGIAAMVQRWITNSALPVYVGWGSSATAPVRADTGLIAPHTEARVAATITRVTGPAPSITNDTLQAVALIQANAAKTVREVILADAVTGGVTWFRATHGDQVLDSAAEGVQYTIQLQVA